VSAGPVLLWVRRPPHSTAHFSEAVRVASMATALNVPLRMLFIAGGVRALVAGQEPYLLGPPVEKILQDIVNAERPALVHAPSLERRGLVSEQLARGVPFRLIDDEEAAQWILDAARTVPL
jgi:sulfur relay (sulfurtransferase) DsrF/TusC family protein